MSIVKNIIPTCETKTSKYVKDKDLLKILTATEMEIKYARHLADNDHKVRNSALKMLKKWLIKRETVLDKDFSILWSGLYVTFWMSDKLLVQEECAENIAALSNVLSSKSALQFFESALNRLSTEWYGIDHLRLDKFLMLVRRLLRKSLQVLAADGYNTNTMTQYQTIMSSILYSGSFENNLGLKMHVTNIYLEEVAKTQTEDLKPATVTQLLQPFIRLLCITRDGRLIGEIATSIFRQLMGQSDQGLDFVEKYKAWRQLGFPGGDISCMEVKIEPVEIEEDEEGGVIEPVLDPRAGRVDVDMPQIKFDAREISDLLDMGKSIANTKSKHRQIINELISDLRTLAAGEYPLCKAQATVELPQREKGIVKKSAKALMSFEANLRDDKSKNRKRKKDVCTNEDDKKQKLNESMDYQKKLVVNGVIKHSLKNTNKITTNSLRQSKNNQTHMNIAAENYELKFTRPSGTWYVFKSPQTPTRVTSTKINGALYVEDGDAPQDFTISDCAAATTPSRSSSPQCAFKSVKLEGAINCTKGDVNSFTTLFNTAIKAKKLCKLRQTQISRKISTPRSACLVKKRGLGRSSEKKVKIALNLNKSQEIHEHELQIKKSPAIPFDANRKPLKPLLKPQCGRFSLSPINPFRKTVKQRQSLML